jgi:hypothetical protein
MALDPKLEKKIDTIYRNTRQMPLLAILGLFVPIILVIGGPLGLLYWFWRRDILQAADSGALALDSVPPPLPNAKRSGELSTAAKFDFIRSHKHSLLIPAYMLAAFVILVGSFICFLVITHPRQ